MTPEEIRASQWSLMDKIYGEQNAESIAANARYQANIDHAVEWGLDLRMDCNDLDPDLMEVYHNVHKSEHGFRPRGFITRPDVLKFLRPFQVKEAA